MIDPTCNDKMAIPVTVQSPNDTLCDDKKPMPVEIVNDIVPLLYSMKMVQCGDCCVPVAIRGIINSRLNIITREEC